MTSFAHSGSTLRVRSLLGFVALAAMLPVGCSNMTSTATQSATATPQARIKGRVHGGNQPVSGATVTVYYAGQSGYGSTGSTGMSTTTANDGYGSFSFTAPCPNAPYFPLVYLIARGGNTLNNGSSSNNSAAEFVAALGPCNQIGSSTFVNMSEVTTVATMAALQQYWNPNTQSFGTDGILLSYAAMAHAVASIPNLVDMSTGTAVSTLTKTATAGGSSVSVTLTPETAKINTIANIISACINNNANGDATACTTLESNAVPPDPGTTSQPTNTLAPASDLLNAVYYMMTNPTDGGQLGAIYALAPGNGAPYQPTLSAAPTDWTIAVSYRSTSTCSNGDGFINSPYDLKLDDFGGVWIDNGSAAGNLAHIGFDGTPTDCAAIAGSSRGSTIDDQGNVWVGSSSTNNIYRYTPGTGAVLTYTTIAPVYAITADGSNNVFFSAYAGTALYEIGGGATASTASVPVLISTTMGSTPAQIMVDATGTIWGSTGTTAVTATAPSSGTYTTTPYTVSGASYGISLVPGNSGNVFSSAQDTNSVDLLGPFTTGYTEAHNYPVSGGGLAGPLAVSADGARNVWVANHAAGVNSVSEYAQGSAALSPATGFVKPSSYLANSRSIIVDQGGNVWISGDGSNVITEIVGAGVPLYQPASIGIAQGRFQTLP